MKTIDLIDAFFNDKFQLLKEQPSIFFESASQNPLVLLFLDHWFVFLGLIILFIRLKGNAPSAKKPLSEKLKRDPSLSTVHTTPLHRTQSSQKAPESRTGDLLSQNLFAELAIIVPARNEEKNLPLFIDSIQEILKAGAKVIIVNDQSTDATLKIAVESNADVCSTELRPVGWSGKNWACHEGFKFLKSQEYYHKINYILFTDADTTHSRFGIHRALDFFKINNSHLMTARPYHKSPRVWEQMMGPFILLVYFITNAKKIIPTPSRFFSIGQFLLFEKRAYEESGGHNAIRSELADDLALAKLFFAQNLSMIVHPCTDIYSCRMYDSIDAFFKGWMRNFRLGFRASSMQTVLESIVVVGSIIAPSNWLLYFIFVGLFWYHQRNEGHFSWLGALLYPLSLFLFIVTALFAMIYNLMDQPIKWKSREYKNEL